MQKFGHNLEKLLTEAMARKLYRFVSLNDREIGIVQLLNHDYAGKIFEYRVTGGTYYLPLIDVTEDVARKLVLGLRDCHNLGFSNGNN